MKIGYFIRRDFLTASPHIGVNVIKQKLLHHAALVIQEEDDDVLGILTPLDIIQRPHNIVVDCLSPKSIIYSECDIETALQIMQREQTDVLPIYNKNHFEGLLFKSDILEFLMAQNTELENKVLERTELLRKSNETLQEIAWIQSHKNRQPIATILGLISLIQKSELTENNKEIFELLESKTKELDQIIHEIVSKTNSIDRDDELK